MNLAITQDETVRTITVTIDGFGVYFDIAAAMDMVPLYAYVKVITEVGEDTYTEVDIWGKPATKSGGIHQGMHQRLCYNPELEAEIERLALPGV